MSQSFLSNIEWRFAAKKFITNKKVTTTDLKKILDAIRLSPSSLGLQPYHIFVISDIKLNEKILPLARNQEQVSTCSHLLVFCWRNDLYALIEGYLQATLRANDLPAEKIERRRLSLRASADRKSAEQKNIWASRQTYIALGFAMAACAELKIDSCPMGGFDEKAVDALLQLPEHMHSVVLLPIGYRAAEPELKKIRFATEDLLPF